jgi:hypothetical protein
MEDEQSFQDSLKIALYPQILTCKCCLSNAAQHRHVVASTGQLIDIIVGGNY